VTELTCAEARDRAAEYGLGILGPEERAAVAAHALRCPDCRRELDIYTRLGQDLMDVIPAAEPPPGFSRKVLAGLPPVRRTRRVRRLGAAAAVVVAASVAVVTGIGLTSGQHHPAQAEATLISHGRPVGTVYSRGRPPWVSMSVQRSAASGIVSCELVESDGTVVRVGSFDLVDGSGSWAAPEPSGVGQIRAVRLVTPDGTVLAQATFQA
jgi:Putative zinc-finger